MQNRINRLEGLVLSLMTNGDQSVGPAAAARALSQENSTGSTGYSQAVDVNGRDTLKEEGEEIDSESDLTTQLGILRVDNNKSLYVGEAHWATVLHDVSCNTKKLYIDLLRLTLPRSLKSKTTSRTTQSSTRTNCVKSKHQRMRVISRRGWGFSSPERSYQTTPNCWHLFPVERLSIGS